MTTPPAPGRPRIHVRPLTGETWPAFERLFGPRGACAGCWCMWFRLPKREFDAGKGEGNRRAMRALVDGGSVPGLLAFVDREAVGWCSVAPREEFSRLARSRTLAPVDDLPVWSVVCLFVARPWRGRGVATTLLEGAADWVAGRGGEVVEGYAVVPRTGRMPDTFAYHGPLSAFLAAGFTEVARPSPSRAIVRRVLGG